VSGPSTSGARTWAIWAGLSGLLNLACCCLSSDPATQLSVSLWVLTAEGLGLIALLRWRGLPQWTGLTASLFICWLHVTWWWADPFSSEDVWRYLWDGAMWWHGASTYLYPPSAPYFDQLSASMSELSALREQVGHPTLSTIYPPGAQQFFRLTSAFGANLLVWRGSLLVAQLLSFYALSRLCVTLRAPRGLAVIPLLCPVWIFDCSLGAHLDTWAITLGLWGLLCAVRGQVGRAGLCFGLGVSVKLIPGLWGFVWLSRYVLERSWRSASRLVIFGLLGLTLVSASEYAELSQVDALTGARAYQERWVFNDSLFSILVSSLKFLTVHETTARAFTQLCLALTLIITPAWMSRRARRRELCVDEETLRVTLIVTVVLLLGSPVVYSWYLGWLIALLPVAWRCGVLYDLTLAWALIIPLSYLPRLSVLSGGVWDISHGWRVVEYLSLGLIFAIRTRYTPPHLLRHILR